jgi:hypothetical protein
MNDVTDGLPAATGCPGSVIPAHVRPDYCNSTPSHTLPRGEGEHLSAENGAVVDLTAVAGALAALDAALAEHGAPDPERTAAWLESEAEPVGAVLAVVPRG